MKPPCEFVTRWVLPAIRAQVARQLVETYGFTQLEAARRLGTTQPAVSLYRQQLRGKETGLLQRASIKRAIGELSGQLARDEIDSAKATKLVCGICRKLRRLGLVGASASQAR